MSKQIEISIEFKDKQIDYKVPSEITLERLDILMHEVLREAKLPTSWTLELKDKSIYIDKSDRIKDLPISNGAIFVLCPLQESEENMDESE